jgi:hypothetical protein
MSSRYGSNASQASSAGIFLSATALTSVYMSTPTSCVRVTCHNLGLDRAINYTYD